MSAPAKTRQIRLPSVDEVLRHEVCLAASARFGRPATLEATRDSLDRLRSRLRSRLRDGAVPAVPVEIIAADIMTRLEAADIPHLRRVFNLTGTVLHTNLGRALLPEAAIVAAIAAMRHPLNLEFDLATGQRGERDDAVRSLVCELTGAEDAIAVNNNAAAVILVLNTLSQGKEAIVSRGELIEIGGSFRMPDIMARAGAKLVEVGTTNRTHIADYADGIGPATGCLLKVHTSNYLIQGFTKAVEPHALAALAKESRVPYVDDLGSGVLIDLARYGLAHERTVQDAIRDGADLVTFSGDKLLGGPQAGIIAGRRDLVRACAKNPMKRAMRLDKVRLAMLEATLRLYRDPDRLGAQLPTLVMLMRPTAELRALAGRLCQPVHRAVGDAYEVTITACSSQIGSGALPLSEIPSIGLAITPKDTKKSGRMLDGLVRSWRALPIPVIGRISEGAALLDLRTLDDEVAFVGQMLAVEPGVASRPP